MRTLALAIAAGLLLSSCSDDPEPIEPTATSSPEASRTPPAVPESAAEESPAGAANFVKFWLDVSNYSARTGDVAPLKEISKDGCSGCARYIDLYSSIYAEGGSIEGVHRTIGEVDLKVRERDVVVSGDVSASEGTYRDTGDSPEQVSEAESTSIEFAVAFENGGWTMTQMGLPASED